MKPPVISISLLIVAISMFALLLCTLMNKSVKKKSSTMETSIMEQKEKINHTTTFTIAQNTEDQ